MKLRTCITPAGEFMYGVHDPSYRVANLRKQDLSQSLGLGQDDEGHDNRVNFPAGDVLVDRADRIYEIPNAFPFCGATYIKKSWADRRALDPGAICLPPPAVVSLDEVLREFLPAAPDSQEKLSALYAKLPGPLLLALAVTSTDPEELVRLASLCCEPLPVDDSGEPTGLRLQEDERGRVRPLIHNHALFEALVNNPRLPDAFKEVMVLRPGIQGESPITGEWRLEVEGSRLSHVFEYLRANSYIPWGHYAANMADDAIRYHIDHLDRKDMTGLRHLYYQRSYVRLAEELGVAVMARWKSLTTGELEELRKKVTAALTTREAHFSGPLVGTRLAATIWGWNYGFDLAPSGYRLHASHQQIHQQFAMLPVAIPCGVDGVAAKGTEMETFSCGDLITEFILEYRRRTGHDFFKDYLQAIRGNQRLDGRDNAHQSLVVYEDEQVVLFVPKAQTSQWELQLMTVRPVGNILEADTVTRDSLDQALLIALKVLGELGASMVTTIEYAKRFAGLPEEAAVLDQRLLYVFLPKLPEAGGGFTEAQRRFICGHYPEDFAAACRMKLKDACRLTS